MDSHNRLLAMLNQAVSSPPVQSPHQPPSNPLSPPPSGAVRESSPLPPPPSLQSLSIDDLFRQLGNSPASAQASMQQQGNGMTSPPASALGGGNGNGNGHQNKLLGMLGGGQQSPASSVGPISPQMQGGATSPLGGNQQTVNLLSLFKSPPPPAQAPAVQSKSVSNESSPRETDQNADPTPSGPADSIAPKPAPTGFDTTSSLQATSKPQLPSKSPFDFVSPFDVFEKPSPKPAAAKVPARAQQSKPEVSQGNGNGNGNGSAFAVPPARINGTVIHPGDVEASTSSPQKGEASGQASPQLPTKGAAPPVRTISQASGTPRAGSKAELTLPWLVSKGSKGGQSKGPKKLTSHVKLDFSKLGDSAIANTDDLTHTIPMTLMKTDKVGFSQGRNVALTENWVAYGLSKGRVRLIDLNSAAKLVLSIPTSVTDVNIVDIAATSTLVAIVTGDSSITIFQVPATFTTEDSQCKQLAHIPAKAGNGQAAGTGLSSVIKVDWVTRGDKGPLLAIGGPEGVIVVELDQLSSRGSTSLSELAEQQLLEHSAGALAFGINHAQTALAVVTSTHLSLYSLATRARVWHKPVVTTSSGSPSSLQFCDSNILIGRANNTTYELVQLHPNHAVLSVIELIAPSPSSPEQHYSQATYDSVNSMLWVAPFARGSILGFKYALKGQPPIKDAVASQGTVVAFDEVVEFPIESVVSMVTLATSSGPEVFYATPSGFSKTSIDNAVFELYGKASTATPASAPAPVPAKAAQPTPAPTPAKAVNGDKKEKEIKSAPKAKHVPKVASPAPPAASQVPAPPAEAPVVETKPDIRALEKAAAASTTAQAPAQAEAPKAVSSPPSAELATLLKQTEDRLSNRFKQNLESQLASAAPKHEQISGASVASEVSAKVEAQIKASVAAAVQQELKKSLVPAASASISHEIRSVAPQAIQAALAQSLSTLSKDVERSLATSLPRIVTSSIQPALERTLQETFKQTVIPALASSSDRLADHIIQEFKSEMVQTRKDFHPPPAPADNGHIIQSLVEAVASLQRKVEQLSIPPVAVAPPPPPPAPVAAEPPVGLEIEEAFTQALAIQGPASIFQLVNDFWGIGEYILPSSMDRKPPFSQAIILTLLHRLAACTTDLNPNDPSLVRLLSWERRVALHLNVNDPALKQYLVRVIPVVISALEGTIHALLTRYGPEASAQHVSQARSIIEILQQKSLSM